VMCHDGAWAQRTGQHRIGWLSAVSYSDLPRRPTGARAALRWAAQPRLPKLCSPPHHIPQEPTMLHYAVVFFVIALIAAVFGFGGIAASAAGIAQVLFFVFIVLAVGSFLFGLIKRR
jgi:uncharacterized membrane protein YtjA (UPF0391 family)